VRVAIGGLWHETHTFANTRTTLADFHAYQFAAGVDLLPRYTGTRTELGGFIAGGAEHGLSLVPLLYAGAVPSGLVTAEAYASLRDDLLARLAAAGPVAGLLLALHGAMVAEGTDDVEADLVARVRQHLGPDLPIIVTVDNHGNLSERLLALADVVLPYATYPHVDMYERGLEACRLLVRMVEGEIRPAGAWRKLPLISAPQAQSTDAPPMQTLMGLAAQLKTEAGLLSTSIAFGYAYSDVARAGLTVLAYADGDLARAEAAVAALAEAAWTRRAEFVVQGNVAPARAVRQALQAPPGLVVLVDGADNIGGGAPGDGTVLLSELLAQGARGAVVTLADPEAVAGAIRAGVRATVELLVGGKQDDWHGPPQRVRGQVRLIADGRYVHRGTYMTGQVTDMGRTAVLDCDGVTVVVMERKAMPFDAQQLRSLAIEPAACRVLVVKSAIAWRAAYGALAQQVIFTDTPGLCSSDLTRFPYKHVPRPVFPLDEL